MFELVYEWVAGSGYKTAVVILSKQPYPIKHLGGCLSQDRWWGVSQMCVCLCESVGIVWGIVC